MLLLMNHSQSIELLNPSPDVSIAGGELEMLWIAPVSCAAATDSLCVSLVPESLEYQPVICDELQVGPCTVTLCSADDTVAVGHAATPLDQGLHK